MKDTHITGQSLSLKNLEKLYGDVRVLESISAHAEAGEFLVLVGPSGCGKSTLLNCIAGLEHISGGAILIGDRNVEDLPPKDRNIAMVFQSYALYPTMTVRENMAFGMKVRRQPQHEIDAKVNEAAKLLQIQALLDRKPSQLSGGQRQRVAMGRALVRDPALFLFDEPLSNLDAKLRLEMRAEIKRLHTTTGATIVYVTHDQIEAMTLATKIIVLKGGHIQQIGTPEEIYDRPANTFVAEFMGSPSMNLTPCTIDGNVLRFNESQSLQVNTIDLPDVTTVTVGIRPEIMQLGAHDATTIPVTVSMIEMTGADSYVSFQLGENRVTARTPGRFSIPVGETAGLSVPESAIHFFDAQNGKLI